MTSKEPVYYLSQWPTDLPCVYADDSGMERWCHFWTDAPFPMCSYKRCRTCKQREVLRTDKSTTTDGQKGASS